ncbi:MAG: 30S ribosome-binding factor RbfA [Candidatus Buchananbacteria bacterium]|nr:30S ribosome-binding factor RbfA [Candidatus Buchananbacteria bacterium]
MSHRLEQISEVIRHEIGGLLLTEVEFPVGCLVTIVEVQTSKDLRHAKIIISVMPVKFTAKVLEKLQKNIGHLQFELNKKLSMKPLPRIRFAIDRTEHKAVGIEELLDKIRKEI